MDRTDAGAEFGGGGEGVHGGREDEAGLFAGRYEIVRPLGQGGMARVLLARDELLDRPVALKVLRDDLARSEEFVSRFRHEAKAAASLSDENIVRVFDAGHADDGAFYISMEYVAGGTLDDRLKREGPLEPAEAARIAVDVALALAAAHEGGIVHRDVKPHNVFLTERGDVKVGDFGIALAAGATLLTQTSLILGTARYISPEVAEGRPATPKSDLYSLGVVLYEMLAGRPPFEADNPVGLAMRHLREDPVPLRVLAPRVPEALEAATMRLLAKDPEDRPASALVAADEIEDAASGVRPTAPLRNGAPTHPTRAMAPAPARRPGGARRTPGRRSSRRLVAVLLGAGLLAALAAPAALAWMDGTPPWGNAAEALPEVVAPRDANGPVEPPARPASPEPEKPAPGGPEVDPAPDPAPAAAPQYQYGQYAPEPQPAPEPAPEPDPKPAPEEERQYEPAPADAPEPVSPARPPEGEPEAPPTAASPPPPPPVVPPEVGPAEKPDGGAVSQDPRSGGTEVPSPTAEAERAVERMQEDIEKELDGVAPGFSFGGGEKQDREGAEGGGRGKKEQTR